VPCIQDRQVASQSAQAGRPPRQRPSPHRGSPVKSPFGDHAPRPSHTQLGQCRVTVFFLVFFSVFLCRAPCIFVFDASGVNPPLKLRFQHPHKDTSLQDDFYQDFIYRALFQLNEGSRPLRDWTHFLKRCPLFYIKRRHKQKIDEPTYR
jgi:hypothetical protein